MKKIKDAIVQRRLLKIRDEEGRERLLEPYACFIGKKGVLIHSYQVSGYSSSGGPGWRNIPLVDIQYATILEEFEPRPEFNPDRLPGKLL
jgi:hypothetical protein